jgi:quercetin dioxygenase-like cupin family protein
MRIMRLSEIAERELVPGFFVRFVHSEHMTFAHWRIQRDAELPLHSHPHEQVVNVLEGEIRLTVEGDQVRLTPGVVLVVPPNAPHSGVALTECRILDVFYPVREDYR